MYGNNANEYEKIVSMNNEQLSDYIKTW
jgi:hypothetical protein